MLNSKEVDNSIGKEGTSLPWKFVKFWRAPIRWKIVGLIVSALVFSMLAYSFVGTKLVIDDKISYIYDQNVGRVSLAATALRSWFEQTQLSGKWIVAASTAEGTAQQRAARMEPVFKTQAQKLGLTGALLLVARADGALELRAKLGAEGDLLAEKWQSLGWNAASFAREPALFASFGSQTAARLVVGLAALGGDGRPVYFVASAHLNERLLGVGAQGGSYVALWDTAALVPLLKAGETARLGDAQVAPLVQSIAAGLLNFSSGAREAKLADDDYVVGYEGGAEHLGFSRLLLVGATPKSVAFESARSLTQRTVVLGLSILLISIGAALLLIRGLVLRLKQLVVATVKVGRGDFSTSVAVEDGTRDELNSLAQSFNTMSDEINKLVAATAQKARMQAELQTAQVVQNLFFPEKPFSHPHISLAGKCVPASECGGDWWFHAQAGDFILVLIGDVTGHGVSAALVTAAAHGAFAAFRRDMAQPGQGKPSLKKLINSLNAAVRSTAGDGATMTLAASLIDLRTGRLELVNASHRSPYIYWRQTIKPLAEGKCISLGSGSVDSEMEFEPAVYQLNPGDLLFWYTDGVLECTNPSGKVLRPRNIGQLLTQLTQNGCEDAGAICEGFMQSLTRFFGDKPQGLEDDVTVVIGMIPKSAVFTKEQDIPETEKIPNAA